MDTQLVSDVKPVLAGCHVRRAIRTAEYHAEPYRYWLPRDVLPAELAEGAAALPFLAADIGDTQGRRETHNASRVFMSQENRAQFPVCEAIASTYQDEATIALIEDRCGLDLTGSYLRIECTMDTDGFWLEPHTDIGAKLFTHLIYLSVHPDADQWGTDIMDEAGKVLGRSPGTFNSGLIFIPGTDTWHGFVKRPIRGVRRSLIINYVKPEWRSRHELAYPDQPIVSAR
jgi:hypothetical protein